MARWLNQLRAAENLKSANSKTDKTDETHRSLGSVGFVSAPSEHIENFRSDWDEQDWRIAFEERAAILEFDEGLTRADAEVLAAQQIEFQRRGKLQ
ncbi:hypothetical protein GPL21_39170 [Bradyrhizobium pachyrhizi]|uniref:Uncharacterized protein n=1 Tax=Bradyrhizobium pachyrhizi TaxID=280333 RepID=A0A844SYK0_9BRAD|nr:hypothetical protein [Bradyrhizobium pachyrhizi]MVT71066.1 hypothetical protein [Bradyrhizobium pachyrhizi]